MRFLLFPLLASAVLGACALPPDAPVESTPAQPAVQTRVPPALDSLDALDELVRVSNLTGEALRAERLRLDGERLATARLQFRQALLLARDDDPASQERALKLLAAIDPRDARTQAVVDLLRTSVRAQLEARRQASRAQELQTRIEQLKALEKSLQQRDDAAKPR